VLHVSVQRIIIRHSLQNLRTISELAVCIIG